MIDIEFTEEKHFESYKLLNILHDKSKGHRDAYTYYAWSKHLWVKLKKV